MTKRYVFDVVITLQEDIEVLANSLEEAEEKVRQEVLCTPDLVDYEINLHHLTWGELWE